MRNDIHAHLWLFVAVIYKITNESNVGSMDWESSQQLQMWFSEHFFVPKLAA